MRLHHVARLGLLPLSGFVAAAPGLEARQSASTLAVDVSKKFQTIDGFGFSEAFQRANNIVDLPEPKRSALVDLLFNATSGAGFTIVRNGIGSSPNSSADWMNTIEPKAPASPAAAATYSWDGKDSGQLWVSQQAAKYGVRAFYADAWSAPGFMKTNGRDSGGGGLCGSPGTNCTTGDWRQAYADYLVKLVQLYQGEGVKITHLGFLNEPDFGTAYASMQMNGEQAADFIKVLHPTLQRSGLADVAIACCEATGWTVQARMTAAIVAAGAEPLVGVFTGHTYTSDINTTQPTARKVWETETSDLAGRWSTDWYTNGTKGDGLTWAANIHTGLTTGNVSAYLWWVATQDKTTNKNNNEKLVLVDDQTYVVSKRLWAFAQYSRVVRPGAVRVAVSAAAALKPTAFVNADGTVAVVVINTASTPASLQLSGLKAASARAWVTDATHDMEPTPASVDAQGAVGGISIPARGVVSVVVVQT